MLNSVVDVLTIYRKQCAPNSSPSQLVIPESLKLLAIYISSALKSFAFRLLNKETENHLDLKVFWIHKYLSMPFGKASYLLYPRVYKISDVHQAVGNQRVLIEGTEGHKVKWGYFTDESEQSISKPKIIPCQLEQISQEDIYVMDNGEYINIFVASKCNPRYVQDVFGYENFSDFALSVDSGYTPFTAVEDSEPSQIVNTLIE